MGILYYYWVVLEEISNAVNPGLAGQLLETEARPF